MTAANSKTGPPCLASRLIVALHLRLIVPRLAPGSRLWLIRDSYAAQTAVLRISAARPGGYRHLAIGDQPGLRLGGHMPMEPVPPPDSLSAADSSSFSARCFSRVRSSVRSPPVPDVQPDHPALRNGRKTGGDRAAQKSAQPATANQPDPAPGARAGS